MYWVFVHFYSKLNLYPIGDGRKHAFDWLKNIGFKC